jgi:PAS domain S-box-containing protein
VHPDDAAATAEQFQQAIDGASVATEFRFRHKDGTYRWLEAVGSNRSHEAAVAGVVINSRDVTHRRATDERLRLLESVAVNARDAILITEAEPVELPGPRIKYVNEAFTKMTGYTPDEIIGKTPRILQGPKTQRSALDKIRAALKAWQPVVVEMVNYHKDGTEFWVELSIVPVADATGWYTHWVSVQRDITRRKEVEAALRAAKEEAEQANRAKSEFLSRMSHELRTPLNAILGFAQLLEVDPANADDRESVEQITKAGRHLLDLINEVLDIARIEAGRLALSIEPVDFDEALREALDIVRPLAAARGIALHAPECGCFVLADRQRIKQVFLNLLSNAIKYNRAGGTVRVSCAQGASENGEATARICVSDSGAGISPEGLDKLFVPFQRLEPETSEVEGIGLGLAICKRIVELMGGAIGASSVPGEGSTFWLELPLAADPSEQLQALAASSPPEEAQRQPAATVLYIEDNLSNLRLVERILTRRPEIKLLAAMQSELGLDLAQQHVPDVILLDLHLPHMHGREVLAQLRADARTSAIPVIVISADATPSEIARMKEAGAAAFLTKPLELPEFLRTLDEALGKSVAAAPPR